MNSKLLNVSLATIFSVSFLVTGCKTEETVEPETVAREKAKAESNRKARKEAAKRDEKVTRKVNAEPMELTGEVIDAWCYCSKVMGDGRGKEHEKCAKLCVAGGVSAGILTDDGTVYIAAKYQGYKGANGILLPYVAKRVKVKGWVAERGGCKVIKVREVEEIKTATDEEESSEKSEKTKSKENENETKTEKTDDTKS